MNSSVQVMPKNNNHRIFSPRLLRPEILFLFLVLIIFPAGAGIVFSDLDLSPDNRLIFRAVTGAGGPAFQDAVFLARLPGPASGSSPQSYTLGQLTAFPEKIDLLENGRILQIRNSFGAVRIPLSGGLPEAIPGFPSFAGGNPGTSGRAEEMAASGDGRWLLYLDPISPALGNLIMLDLVSGAKTQVTSRLERPEKAFPASWSPDSRFFIYERDGKLYYFRNGSYPTLPDERTRLIGEGSIGSVSWTGSSDFFYLRGTTLLRVRGIELSTRAFYTDIVNIGVIAGKIPFDFDPVFDCFWVAPDASSLLVSKGRRTLFYFPLDNNAAALSDGPVMPYLLLPRSSSEIKVFWPPGGEVTILISIPDHIEAQVMAYRLKIPGNGRSAAFEIIPPPDSGISPRSFPNGSLSPDGKLILFWGAEGIVLYDYVNWKLLDVLGIRQGLACLWAGNSEFIIGDDNKIERLRLLAAENNRVIMREMVCLSRAFETGFEENTFRVLAKNGDTWFASNGREPWTPVLNPRLKSSSRVSSLYRVYLERQNTGYYENLPFIRNLSSVGTFSLFPSVPGDVIWTGKKEAALCFDLYDDDQGLPEVLEALNRFGFKATFFLNGEFLRRYPQAVLDIVSAGHETASMFFSIVDLSDSRYRVSPDFITRGLARNEDDFFRAAGKELALLWHPPWYSVSPEIAASAAGAGYRTIRRDIDPGDWVSLEEEKRLGLVQKPPSEMIDGIMGAVKPLSIIPVRLGLLSGGRNNYLFNRINVLLDALVREGYSVVPVSAVMEK